MTTYTAQKLNECNDADATPVIVDYDVNIDDVVALAFLAKSRMYEIKAVIVTGTALGGKQGVPDLGQLALRRPLSAPDRASGHPEPSSRRPFSRLGRAGTGHSGRPWFPHSAVRGASL